MPNLIFRKIIFKILMLLRFGHIMHDNMQSCTGHNELRTVQILFGIIF